MKLNHGAPSYPVRLYECAGCKHIYMERVSSCDCMENPGNEYIAMLGFPDSYIYNLLRKSLKEMELANKIMLSNAGVGVIDERVIQEIKDALP